MRYKLPRLLFAALVLAVTGMAVPLSAQPRYVVNDLGTLGGASSTAQGINNSGQTVGQASLTGDSAIHAFRTVPSAPINPATDDLGTLANTSFSQALGINDAGQVVGVSYVPDDIPAGRAFRTAPDAPINPATDDLGTLGGTFLSRAWGINSAGQVVGLSYITGDSAGLAFRTAPNAPINPATDDLGTLGGTVLSEAFGIDFSGRVVGDAATKGDVAFHAFRTATNGRINPATDDLGTLGGTVSSAYGINSSGQVVGLAYTAGNSAAHPFRTAANASINPATDDLGTLGGRFSGASGINNSGDVVGSSYLSDNNTVHGFIYTGGGLYDLNSLLYATSGWELQSAAGINDAGQIVGSGIHNGATRAFRLDPLITVGIVVNIGTPRPASLNIDSEGALDVAILGSASFDVTTIDPTSVLFGPKGAKNIRAPVLQDVNKDGKPDLVLHFAPSVSGLKCSDKVVALIGTTLSKQLLFTGSETIKSTHTFPCKQ
jgi:probable HAF family extracellular repeat protein